MQRLVKSSFQDEPRSLGKKAVREERLAHWDASHVQILNSYVNELRRECQEKNSLFKDRDIPYFDPMDGGTEAKCLFLFEAPGGKALDSGFASRNNNDQSAENLFKMNKEVDLDRELTVSWNVVPWALRESNKNRKPKDAEIAEAEEPLRRVLDFVEPEVVVLFGLSAHKAENLIASRHTQPCIIPTNHSSPLNINSRPEMWQRITAALSRAKSCITEAKG